MITDERNFVEFEDNDYLDAVEYSKKMRNALNNEFDNIDLNVTQNTKKIEKLEENITDNSNYSNAIKERVEQVKEAQIHSSGAVLQNVELFGESAQGEDPSINNPSPIINIASVNYKVTGKNLLDLAYNTGYTTTNYGVTFTINEDKSITLNGTSTSSITFRLNYNSDTYIKLKSGKYTSYLKGKNKSIGLITRKVDVSGALLSVPVTSESEISTNTLELEEKIETFTYLSILNGATFNNLTVYPMILKGEYTESTMDKYEPYKGNIATIQLPIRIKLCSLPNGIRDSVDSNGVIHKNTKKIVLNGTENWYVYANYTGAGYCYYLEDNSFPLLPVNSAKYKQSLCTHFKNVYATWLNGTIGTYSDHGTVHRKYFITDKATLVEFKAWLAENTPELVYTLAEEDVTQSLADTEIAKLQTLQTFLGVNNIEISAPTNFTYVEDNNYTIEKLRQENKSLEDRLSVVENLLSSTATASLLLENAASDNESEVM